MQKILLVLLFVFGQFFLMAQEYHFKFQVQSKDELKAVTKIISIDNVQGNNVEAYANNAEMLQFLSLGYKYEFIQPNTPKILNMATTVAQMANWDRYPTYEVYVQMMENFAANYPTICQLEEIGTLSSGRKLLAIKISDNVTSNNEAEPELFYTGTMHGDETTGFILLLRLADYLLNHYGDPAYPAVNNLVNQSEIWINPAANPDGTYNGGNSTLSGSQRYNASGIDINRNFPDPGLSNPTSTGRAPETVMMMNFAINHHFALSANFHGGIEVANYPWDTWPRLSADDAWWVYVSRNYANSAQANSPSGYFDDLDNGITNGYQWYEVHGGRQDYMNYYHHCREITMEISNTKLLSTDQLVNHWNYNKDGLMNYLTEGLYGVRGVVSNAQGQPLAAKVEVLNHEADNSWVETDSRAGDFARYLKAGTYSIKFSAQGYVDKIIDNITVTDGAATILNVTLGLPRPYLMVENTSIDTMVIKDKTLYDTIILTNAGYAPFNYTIAIENAIQNPWITLNQTSGTLQTGQAIPVKVTLNATNLTEQVYTANIVISGDSNMVIPVTMEVYTTPELKLNKLSFSQSILTNQTTVDTLVINNIGNANLSYSLSINQASVNNWLSLNNASGVVEPGASAKVALNFTPVKAGYFSTQIQMGGSFTKTIPVTLRADTLPYVQLFNDSLVYHQLVTDSTTHEFNLKNAGGGILNYTCNNRLSQIFSLPVKQGSLVKGAQAKLKLIVNSKHISKGRYIDTVFIYSTYDTTFLPMVVYVDTLPKLAMLSAVGSYTLFEGKALKDTLVIKNQGGSVLNYAPTLHYKTGLGWVSIPTSSVALAGGSTSNFIFTIDATKLKAGNYSAIVKFNDADANQFSIDLSVIKNPELFTNKASITAITEFKENRYDTLILSNLGGAELPYTLSYTENNPTWLSINKESGSIPAFGFDTLVMNFKGELFTAGLFETKLEITTTSIKKILVRYTMLGAANMQLSSTEGAISLTEGAEGLLSFNMQNTGASKLYYQMSVTEGASWLAISTPKNGTLASNESVAIELTIKPNDLVSDTYHGQIRLQSLLGDAILQTETFLVNLNLITGITQDPTLQNGIYPNPFTTETYIKVPKEVTDVKVFIYNSLGTCVYNEENPANRTQEGIIWNGTNTQGQTLPAGLYLVNVVSKAYSFTGKVYKK